MKIQYPSFKFLLILVIILFVSQLSNCRKIQEITPTSIEQRLNSRISWHNLAPSPKKSRNEDIDKSYRVSHRIVPGGPNPLHN